MGNHIILKVRDDFREMMERIIRQERSMAALTDEELHNRFTSHDPKGNQSERYDAIRAECLATAITIRDKCPVSRESSVALTKLDEVMFWANASIARAPD